MKCKCSLNNGHKIIGVCDLEQFNAKIEPFKDSSYTQISLPDQIYIPNNLPNLKTILKIYLNINIISTKVVNTPKSNTESLEGLKLTGKMLLVYGYLDQTIIYSNNKNCKSKYSLKSKTPFNTYIVLDEEADKNTDVYCIYPYVENLSLIPLSERTLHKGITLFLFAHNITEKPAPPPPSVTKLLNAFVFNSESNTEMARLEFDKTNKKLIVTSTNVVYGTGDENAFVFQLVSSPTSILATGVIKSNGNADEFKKALDGVDFKYGNILYIDFLDSSKVTLTNYPEKNTTYNMVSFDSQSFKITEDGIVPNTLPNEIILSNSSNQTVVTVKLDDFAEKLLVKSTGYATNSGGNNYFKMTLYEEDGMTLIISANIEGNSAADDFETEFNDEIFEYDYILKLESEEPNEVTITNFPTSETKEYHPQAKEEWFQITKTGLIKFTPSSVKTTFLPNAFVFTSFDKDEEIAMVEFDKKNKKLVVGSTGISYNGSGSENAFIFQLINPSITSVKTGTILPNGNADEFKKALNEVYFDYGYFIYLRFLNSSKVFLTNYPEKDKNYSMLGASSQTFKITEDGIVPNTLLNKIMLNNSSKQLVVSVEFDALNKLFLVASTEYTANQGGGDAYFTMSLYETYDSLDSSFSIASGENGSKFKSYFSSTAFESGNLIKLEYKEREMVVVTNFPNEGTPTYNPKGSEEWFQITNSSLISFTPPPSNTEILSNTFIFNSINDEEIARLEIDKTSKKLKVTSTGVIYGSDYNSVFSIDLLDSCHTTFKASSRIRGDQDASEFMEKVNGVDFEFNDLIVINAEDLSKVILINYPNNDGNNTTDGEPYAFTISENGLLPFNLTEF